MENTIETTIVYWGNIEMMGKKMKAVLLKEPDPSYFAVGGVTTKALPKFVRKRLENIRRARGLASGLGFRV